MPTQEDIVKKTFPDPQTLRVALLEGATNYLFLTDKTVSKEEKTAKRRQKDIAEEPGFFHGQDGIMRATNLKRLVNDEPDLVKLFSFFYAVMCPRGLKNAFESRSSFLAACIMHAIIKGKYEYLSNSAAGIKPATTNTLQSETLAPTKLKELTQSLNSPSMEAHSAMFAFSVFFSKLKAGRILAEQVKKELPLTERLAFDGKVADAKKALLTRPTERTPSLQTTLFYSLDEVDQPALPLQEGPHSV